MFIVLGEKHSPGWTCTVATHEADIPFMLAFLYNFKKGALYWRHGNISLLDHMNYNTQCWDDPTIQHFMWGGLIIVEFIK